MALPLETWNHVLEVINYEAAGGTIDVRQSYPASRTPLDCLPCAIDSDGTALRALLGANLFDLSFIRLIAYVDLVKDR
jgi:hypothetical protein